ncbi:MAG TPA: serine O-acetyltransferase EpsC [Bacteroidota bacterium]|nr:serine O-acetyltransferase EpsC [Bacteroidota bacterium]
METVSHDQFIRELLNLRTSRLVSLPVKAKAARFIEELLELMFPHFSDEVFYAESQIEGQFQILLRDLRTVLQPLERQLQCSVADVAEQFARVVPTIYRELLLDAEAIHRGDPAAESVDEVISAYPGFYAIAIYRIAHEFYSMNVPIFPRILTESAHHRTGIDIHPGAVIGRSLCIDHGTGIVIGETSVIGDDVKIYQGVTLGALSVDKTLASHKRHPTIEDNVVIYSNATILGGETVIGRDSVIGGNVWLTESVPPHSVVYHKSEVRVRDKRDEAVGVDFSI